MSLGIHHKALSSALAALRTLPAMLRFFPIRVGCDKQPLPHVESSFVDTQIKMRSPRVHCAAQCDASNVTQP